MLKWKYNDIESAEKKIQSFTNALIFCSVLPIIFLLLITLHMHKFPDALIEPVLSCSILFVLSIFLKTTKSRAISIIIFVGLLDSSVGRLLTSSGLPSSGTIVSLLMSIAAFFSIKATFARVKLLKGKTIFKNVLIRNLFGLTYSAIFFYTVAIMALYIFALNNIRPNFNFMAIVILFLAAIVYLVAIFGKLPFTKKFKMVIYPERQTPELIMENGL